MDRAQNLLVVDDEPRLLKTLEMIISAAGYQTSGAGNATTVLDCLSKGHYDLLILDWQLPDMDGTLLLKEIRRLYPNLPVVVVTGNGSIETADMVIQLGARYFLLKPFDPGFIVSLVQDILRNEKANYPVKKYHGSHQPQYTQTNNLQ
jgi:DNA-binding NtrC family response regulator